MKKILTLVAYFILFVVSVWAGYFYFSSRQTSPVIQTHIVSTSLTPSIIPSYNFEPAPTETLNAQIIKPSGEVQYISRIATEAANLSVNMLRQGESILTGKDGHVEIQFPASESAILAKMSKVDIIQSLPGKIILEHQLGTVTYTSKDENLLSIRVKRLLASLSAGEITVTYDENRDMVSIAVLKGQLTTAYNDSKFVSQVQTITAGHRGVFDNEKRKLTIK